MIRNLKEMREALKSTNWAQISRDTKIPYITVQRILNGSIDNPRYKNFIAIYEWNLKNVK